MLCYLKFHFKQEHFVEENQYTTNPFLLFRKKTGLKNKKKVISYLIM